MNALRSTVSRAFSRAIGAGLCALPAIAAAHPGHYHPPGEEDEFDTFANGLLHPLTGIDHLLLALAVGWLAFSLGKGKARLPLSAFLAALAIGAWSGRGLQGGAALEAALSVTLLAAGALFVWRKNLQVASFAVAAGLGGFTHGYAHGAEAMPGPGFLAYSIGFIGCTAGLTMIGGALHLTSSRLAQPLVPRIAGGALMAIGSALLIQAL